jgi:hypothetical protein
MDYPSMISRETKKQIYVDYRVNYAMANSRLARYVPISFPSLLEKID